jgi:hypothetical protein
MLALGEVFAEALSVRFIQLFLRRTRAARQTPGSRVLLYGKGQPVSGFSTLTS